MIGMFVAWVVAGVAATVLHEMTHLIAGLAIGREVRFDPWNWEVLYTRARPSTPTLGTYFIAAAPVLVGGLILVGVMAIGYQPRPAWWFGWGIYTLVGAVTGDFDMSPVATDDPGANTLSES